MFVIFIYSDGSNQSIYSAEEANPETDSVFEQSMTQAISSSTSVPVARQERSASLETEIRITTNRTSGEKSQSLGDEPTTQPMSLVVTTTTNQIQCLENNGNQIDHHNNDGTSNQIVSHEQDGSTITANMNITNNNISNTNVNGNQIANSLDNSTLSTTTTTIILTTNSRVNRTPINEESPRPAQQRSTYQMASANYSPTNQQPTVSVQ